MTILCWIYLSSCAIQVKIWRKKKPQIWLLFFMSLLWRSSYSFYSYVNQETSEEITAWRNPHEEAKHDLPWQRKKKPVAQAVTYIKQWINIFTHISITHAYILKQPYFLLQKRLQKPAINFCYWKPLTTSLDHCIHPHRHKFLTHCNSLMAK